MIIVYTKDLCPYCDGAKAYLNKIGEPFEAVNITNNPDLREWLINQGHKTLPQVYYKDKLLVEGGYTGLGALLPSDIESRKNAIDQSLLTE